MRLHFFTIRRNFFAIGLKLSIGLKYRCTFVSEANKLCRDTLLIVWK